jgi:hypothetical protein
LTSDIYTTVTVHDRAEQNDPESLVDHLKRRIGSVVTSRNCGRWGKCGTCDEVAALVKGILV